jgi:Xaa-Pro aminopeptidase
MHEKIISKIRSLGCDGYVSFDSAENYYLTGFSSSFGVSILFQVEIVYFLLMDDTLKKLKKN